MGPSRAPMEGHERPRLRRAASALVVALLVVGAGVMGGALARDRQARPTCAPRVQFYGTYSIGTRAGAARVELAERLRELRALGGNMIVASGPGAGILEHLPPGMLAVPGCGLMARKHWQSEGRWDEARARRRLAALAEKFAGHPQVYGICLTHEITEYADHDRRVWMYRLAKEYFPEQAVIHYYASLFDQENPGRRRVDGYGRDGERETDVLFVSLQGGRKGVFQTENVKVLERALRAAARTPGVPVWGQTSINADHKYVTGPDSMLRVWGRDGENMQRWVETLARTVHRDPRGFELRLSGFFWRSLGRFPYDLGEPRFRAHRARVHQIAKELCLS